ncbi:hypothetical protein [Isoptericola dokdonensis]|uniref:DUF624 domain-containing protein n=1 Tax=Isoptericola dokdonensis DS-3 TaxID=1300344 RepID=A0A161IDR2_9MICO|nr:hypothetical protein [Isoptericola dokdonensis]ANC31387.1 hypothetical protein I598_1839 [Isoptericola dokdonensis DS-3]
MAAQAGARDPGEGILSRVAGRVYWYATVGLLVALGCVPSLVALLMLDGSPGNVLVLPLCLAPAVPFVSAGLFTLHVRARAEEPAPARTFARGLRLNTSDVLLLVVPALVVLGIVATSVVHREAAGIGTVYVVVLLVVALLVVLWALQALVLASVFRFRVRDVARLALHYLTRRPGATVGLLALVVVAGGVVAVAGEVGLVVVGVAWLWFLLRVDAPVLADVTDRFVA